MPRHAASLHEIVGSAATALHQRMEEGHRRRCKERGERAELRPHLPPLAATVCWWRARVAQLLDINHQIVIPNAVVECLALEAPQSGRAVLQVLLLRSSIVRARAQSSVLRSVQAVFAGQCCYMQLRPNELLGTGEWNIVEACDCTCSLQLPHVAAGDVGVGAPPS